METNSVAFFQSQHYPEPAHKPIVAALKVKNPQNVGSLMRLVDNVGGDTLYLLDDENPKRESSIKKTAGLSYKNVKLVAVSSEVFFQSIPKDYALVAIETNEESTNVFTTKLPDKIAFLLGSEMHGLPEKHIARCALSVHIPMTGRCKSMNISHALSVTLFEWLRQQLFIN
ncbi:TrmH family RNA methyltransferase [Sunxiuqinia sp. sy24]|uniref:TrmH family RNA methyltransferase n=1 Tax=Sunxiuqinia sp. sy24 TaxID=3461495 RepID=UPI00404580EF